MIYKINIIGVFYVIVLIRREKKHWNRLQFFQTIGSREFKALKQKKINIYYLQNNIKIK